MTMIRRELPKIGVPRYRDVAPEEITLLDSKPRTVRFVASSEAVDRYGDIIRLDGWNLDNYQRHPIVLWAHQSRLPEIGKAEMFRDEEGKKLMADVTFWPEGTSAFVDDLWRIFEAGGLRASSVGFLPTATPNYIYATDDPGPDDWPTGYEFIGQELLELSVVSVPANPEALAVARSLGLAEATIRRLFTSGDRTPVQPEGEKRRRMLALARLKVGYFERS